MFNSRYTPPVYRSEGDIIVVLFGTIWATLGTIWATVSVRVASKKKKKHLFVFLWDVHQAGHIPGAYVGVPGALEGPVCPPLVSWGTFGVAWGGLVGPKGPHRMP